MDDNYGNSPSFGPDVSTHARMSTSPPVKLYQDRPSLSYERARRIAKSVLRYSQIAGLTLEGVTFVLQSALPSISEDQWSTYCRNTFKMVDPPIPRSDKRPSSPANAVVKEEPTAYVVPLTSGTQTATSQYQILPRTSAATSAMDSPAALTVTDAATTDPSSVLPTHTGRTTGDLSAIVPLQPATIKVSGLSSATINTRSDTSVTPASLPIASHKQTKDEAATNADRHRSLHSAPLGRNVQSRIESIQKAQEAIPCDRVTHPDHSQDLSSSNTSPAQHKLAPQHNVHARLSLADDQMSQAAVQTYLPQSLPHQNLPTPNHQHTQGRQMSFQAPTAPDHPSLPVVAQIPPLPPSTLIDLQNPMAQSANSVPAARPLLDNNNDLLPLHNGRPSSHQSGLVDNSQRTLGSRNTNGAYPESRPRVQTAIQSRATRSAVTTNRKSKKGPEKQKSVLAHAVLLASGKLTHARLNAGLEPYRYHDQMPKDLRQFPFDSIDPPVPGSWKKLPTYKVHPTIHRAWIDAMQGYKTTQSQRHLDNKVERSGGSAPCPPKSLVTLGGTTSGGNIGSTGPIVSATLPSVQAQAAKDALMHHQNMRSIIASGVPGDVITQEPQDTVCDVTNSNKTADPSISAVASAEDKKLSTQLALSTNTPLTPVEVRIPVVTSLAFPTTARIKVAAQPEHQEITAEVPPEATQLTDGSIVSEHLALQKFSIEIIPRPPLQNVQVDRNEATAMAELEAAREVHRTNKAKHSAVMSSDQSEKTDLGYPVYKCGWHKCGAELHNFETLIRHCDLIHGRPTEDGIYHCLWGICRISQNLTFKTFDRWQNHTDEEHQQAIKHACLYKDCKKCFSEEEDLQFHVAMEHEDVNQRRKRNLASESADVPEHKRRQMTFHTSPGKPALYPVFRRTDESESDGGVLRPEDDELDLLGFSPATNSWLRPRTPKESLALTSEDRNQQAPTTVPSDILRTCFETSKNIGWEETWDLLDNVSIVEQPSRPARRLLEAAPRPMPAIAANPILPLSSTDALPSTLGSILTTASNLTTTTTIPSQASAVVANRPIGTSATDTSHLHSQTQRHGLCISFI